MRWRKWRGELIDPYGGQQDLEQRILRHVSPAFEEDPLRVLRVARFYARFQYLGFTVAPETLALMQQMVASGELSHLVAERVWQESYRRCYLLRRKLTDYCAVRCSCSDNAGVVNILSESVLAALQQTAQQRHSDLVCFGCLFLQAIPEQHSAKNTVCDCLPTAFSELMQLVVQQNAAIMALSQQLSAEAVMEVFEVCDAFRRGERFESLLQVMVVGGLPESLRSKLQQWLVACVSSRAQDVMSVTIKGKARGEALRRVRLECLQCEITA